MKIVWILKGSHRHPEAPMPHFKNCSKSFPHPRNIMQSADNLCKSTVELTIKRWPWKGKGKGKHRSRAVRKIRWGPVPLWPAGVPLTHNAGGGRSHRDRRDGTQSSSLYRWWLSGALSFIPSLRRDPASRHKALPRRKGREGVFSLYGFSIELKIHDDRAALLWVCSPVLL